MSGVAAIERVNFATLREPQTWLAERTAPAVISASVDPQILARHWSPAGLLSSVGAKAVNVLLSDAGTFDFDDAGRRKYEVREMPFAEALASIVGAGPDAARWYVRESLSDVGVEPVGHPGQRMLPVGARAEPNFWVSPAACVTPLHYDKKNNLFTQTYGRKRLTLFPPDEYARLYPQGFGSHAFYVSRVDPESVDRSLYPDFPDRLAFIVELSAGDTLFIPAFWWHHVRSLDLSISVNEWWSARPEQFLAPNAVDFLRTDYQKERLAYLFAGEDGSPAPRLAALAEAARTRSLPCTAALFSGAATHFALRYLAARHGVEAHDDADTAQLARALVEDGALDADEAKRAQLWLFFAHVAAAQGKTPNASELESMTRGVADFVSKHTPPESSS